MGHVVDLRCRYCRYEEKAVAVGHGRQPTPALMLFSCPNCHSFGSSWVTEGEALRCSWCYHDAVQALPNDVTAIACPKCGERATVTHQT